MDIDSDSEIEDYAVTCGNEQLSIYDVTDEHLEKMSPQEYEVCKFF